MGDAPLVAGRSHLFTLRIWAEPIGGGRTEWRGKVERVSGPEARYFRDWQTLIDHLLDMLPEPAAERGQSSEMEGTPRNPSAPLSPSVGE